MRWEQLGYAPSARLAARDLYAARDLGVFSEGVVAAVGLHDVVALRLTPAAGGGRDDGWRPWAGGVGPYASHPEDADTLRADCAAGLPAAAGVAACISAERASLGQYGIKQPLDARAQRTSLLHPPTVEAVMCCALSLALLAMLVATWRRARADPPPPQLLHSPLRSQQQLLPKGV